MKGFLHVALEFELSPEDCREPKKDLKVGSDVGMHCNGIAASSAVWGMV